MSKELAKTYDPKGLEDRLYQKWLDNATSERNRTASHGPRT